MQLELSECCSMYTIPNAFSVYTTHTHSAQYIEYCEPISEYFFKQLFAISTYVSCVIAHSMIIMSCNSSNLMAFDRGHLE